MVDQIVNAKQYLNEWRFVLSDKLRQLVTCFGSNRVQSLHDLAKRRKTVTKSCLQKLINWKYLAKIVVIFLGFFGFVYQSSEYFVKYFNYPTFVDVRQERSSIIDIPSVTLCIPSLTSRTRLIKAYPEIIDKLEVIRRSDKKSAAIEERELFRTYENQSAAMLSPQRFFALGIHAEEIIECNVLRPQLFGESATEAVNSGQNWIPCEKVAKVLETIGPNGKCFTYFTKLGQTSEDLDKRLQIDMYKSSRDKIGLVVEIALTLNPKEYVDEAKVGDESITLHENRGVPTEVKHRRLKAGTTYSIFFTKTLTTNLPMPFSTDCIDYQLLDPTRPQSRVDCVDRCVKDIYYVDCNCYPLHVVVRHDIVINNDNLSLCNESSARIEWCQRKEVQSRCYEKCKLDCNQVTYDFDTEEDEHPSDRELLEADGEELVRLEKIRNYTAGIKLWRKISGDTLFEYKKELPLVQLFSFVGGLASLWLGISFIAFYDFLVRAVKVVYRSKPFEKMRKRDAAMFVLGNWNGKRKNKLIKLIKVNVDNQSARIINS